MSRRASPAFVAATFLIAALGDQEWSAFRSRANVVDVNPGSAIGVTPNRPPPTSAPVPQAGSRREETPSDDTRELQSLLSRVVSYVAGYRQQYSAIVADEDYTQRTTSAQVRLRSDFLLVRTETDEGWVSFRDVYSVDGARVRDRDDRLKKLFLEPTTDSASQLEKIKEESARYNIGDEVGRNVNVPLFPLNFLDLRNVPRFQFRLVGRRDALGRRTIRYDERQRPTIVRGVQTGGSLLVDEASGAVVETRTVYVDALNQTAELVVQYTHDPKLGLWVPSAMNEEYRGSTGNVLLTGRAEYSNFRRFQVTTDEQIRIKTPESFGGPARTGCPTAPGTTTRSPA
jgi:hypothetical protein